MGQSRPSWLGLLLKTVRVVIRIGPGLILRPILPNQRDAKTQGHQFSRAEEIFPTPCVAVLSFLTCRSLPPLRPTSGESLSSLPPALLEVKLYRQDCDVSPTKDNLVITRKTRAFSKRKNNKAYGNVPSGKSDEGRFHDKAITKIR